MPDVAGPTQRASMLRHAWPAAINAIHTASPRRRLSPQGGAQQRGTQQHRQDSMPARVQQCDPVRGRAQAMRARARRRRHAGPLLMRASAALTARGSTVQADAAACQLHDHLRARMDVERFQDRADVHLHGSFGQAKSRQMSLFGLPCASSSMTSLCRCSRARAARHRSSTSGWARCRA